MNLSFTSLGKIFFGSLFGAGVIWAISFLVPKDLLGTYGLVVGVQQLGLAIGALIGAAFTTMVLIVLDSHHAETGGATNFTMINGMGSKFSGKSDRRDDGSYVTTEWFCLIWLPLFPVCNYRLVKVAEHFLIPSILGSRRFAIKEKHPVRLNDVAKGYLRAAALACLYGLGALILMR
jgi:hypothetical protein